MRPFNLLLICTILYVLRGFGRSFLAVQSLPDDPCDGGGQGEEGEGAGSVVPPDGEEEVDEVFLEALVL